MLSIQKKVETEVTIEKDVIRQPFNFQQDKAFSVLNSVEWFKELEQGLVKNVHSQFRPEVELEYNGTGTSNEKQNGIIQTHKDHDNHHEPHKAFGHITSLDSASRVNK